MRKRLKIQFSAMFLLAFMGQSVGAHACLSAVMSPAGIDAHISAAPTGHDMAAGEMGNADQPHCYDCKDDCNGAPSISGDPTSLSKTVQVELSKAKSFVSVMAENAVFISEANRLRAPPPHSRHLPPIPTSLFSQHTHLLI
jgi:hypothetical protein